MNMLSRAVHLKTLGRLSYSTSKKVKVQNLPDDDSFTFFGTSYSFRKLRKPRRIWFTDALATLHIKWDVDKIIHWQKWKKINEIHEEQNYIPERHKALGSDLAAAHFITFRGGKVKFRGNDEWITDKHINNQEIPSYYHPAFCLEEIDASNTLLCYEGLENFSNLRSLKKLILRDCVLIDDWCLRRCYIFKNTLEHLDVSGCQNITERGISTLYVLQKLKTLVFENTPNIQNRELVCLLLQEIIPECKVIGVNYEDPILLKRLESYMR